MDQAKISRIGDAILSGDEEVAARLLYGDKNGDVPSSEHKPTTMQEKIHAASKAKLLRAGKIAALAGMITAHQVREKKTIELKELQPWPDRERHSTEPLLKGRRGKKSRRQRKAAR